MGTLLQIKYELYSTLDPQALHRHSKQHFVCCPAAAGAAGAGAGADDAGAGAGADGAGAAGAGAAGSDAGGAAYMEVSETTSHAIVEDGEVGGTTTSPTKAISGDFSSFAI